MDASTLPVFSFNRAVKWGYASEERVTVPIRDNDAFAAYYLACLQTEKAKYSSPFSAVRSAVIQGR